MAVMYLGRNNQAKKISEMYVGINDQSKRVIKGYVGVNGYSKLFYSKYLYPTIKYIENPFISTLSFKKSFEFSKQTYKYPESDIITGTDYAYIAKAEDGTGIVCYDPLHGVEDKLDPFIVLYGYDKFYLNENSSNFLAGNLTKRPALRTLNNLGTYKSSDNINIETFLFNKVENLYNFCNGMGGFNPNLIGNINNCNFINVINMSSAFINCHQLTGSPICGNKVTNMYRAYYWCDNLTGPPVCNNNVIHMAFTYFNCSKLSKANIHFYGNNIYRCFHNANIYGNIYLYNYQTDFNDICYNKQGTGQLNIYISSKLPILSHYTKISPKITGYQKIDDHNYLLIGETKIYLNNTLIS